jgi:hypothetical protein
MLTNFANSIHAGDKDLEKKFSNFIKELERIDPELFEELTKEGLL